MPATWAFALYLSLSLLFFGRHLLPHPGAAYLGGGADPGAIMWFLKWWPYAIARGLNPFVTHLVWAPTGANLAGTTSIPGLALAAAPLTVTAGPLISYNALYLLAPALSAWSMFLLARRLTGSGAAALASGYLYGFSSYELSKMSGHLNLAMVFIPPLLVLLVLRRMDGEVGPPLFVGLLAALLILQFLISTEVFLSMSVFGGVALVAAALILSGEERGRLLRLAGPIAASYGAAAVVLSPYLYYVIRALSQPPIYDFYSTLFVTDPLNFVLPTSLTYVGSGPFSEATSKFTGNLSEQSAYLGLPVLAIVGWYGLRAWRTRSGRILLVVLAAVLIATLGPKLTVLGRTSVPLPWTPLVHVPLVKYALPARFAVYLALVTALMAGRWLTERSVPRWAKAVLLPLAIVSLLPTPSGDAWRTSAASPPFFSSGLYREQVRRGDTVIVIPYGDRGYSMLWQVQSEFWFRMAGGYVTVVPPKEFSDWSILRTLYEQASIPDMQRELRAFLGAHRVRQILVAEGSGAFWDQLFRPIDPAPRAVGGVVIYRVPEAVFEEYSSATPSTPSGAS